MLRNTFFGAIIRLVISEAAISKSICGNLNIRLKKRGILTPSSRDELCLVLPKLEAPELCRGREMCGFMIELLPCRG